MSLETNKLPATARWINDNMIRIKQLRDAREMLQNPGTSYRGIANFFSSAEAEKIIHDLDRERELLQADILTFLSVSEVR